MKSKMRITGNRTVIGIICIVLALGITFGIALLSTASRTEKWKWYR